MISFPIQFSQVSSLIFLPGMVLETYDKAVKSSSVFEELYACRNVRPSFHTPLGLWGGTVLDKTRLQSPPP